MLAREFPLRGTVTVADLADIYGIGLSESPESTLEQVIRRRAPEIAVGTTVTLDGVRLRVRELSEGRILSMGLRIEQVRARAAS